MDTVINNGIIRYILEYALQCLVFHMVVRILPAMQPTGPHNPAPQHSPNAPALQHSSAGPHPMCPQSLLIDLLSTKLYKKSKTNQSFVFIFFANWLFKVLDLIL